MHGRPSFECVIMNRVSLADLGKYTPLEPLLERKCKFALRAIRTTRTERGLCS
jgi:hypothetical protein